MLKKRKTPPIVKTPPAKMSLGVGAPEVCPSCKMEGSIRRIRTQDYIFDVCDECHWNEEV